MLNGLVTTVREGARYKGESNQWMWIAHRISGLGVLLFLVTHISGMSFSYFNPKVHEALIEIYKTPLFSVGELFLAACLVFHAINGTRIALLELKPEWWSEQHKATRASLLITFVLGAPTLVIMAWKSLSFYLATGR